VLPVAARALGLIVQPWQGRDAESLAKQPAAMGNQRPDGLYAPGGGQREAIQKKTPPLPLKSRLPPIYGIRTTVNAAFLMYYGADLADSYRRVAYFVDRILKGAKPADLPVEQPTKFELVINLKTAKQIGVTIPPEVLARATTLIK